MIDGKLENKRAPRVAGNPIRRNKMNTFQMMYIEWLSTFYLFEIAVAIVSYSFTPTTVESIKRM